MAGCRRRCRPDPRNDGYCRRLHDYALLSDLPHAPTVFIITVSEQPHLHCDNRQQNDIRKCLPIRLLAAWLHVLACGVGALSCDLSLLHAFFKALLFLGSAR